jgi:2-amino-4-hydroxy-6-hydroxymethyldihydropteridine diphosphokinase
LGLGANLGDRLASLRQAATLLCEHPAVTQRARSMVYQSPPAGGPPQPDYLNAALLVGAELEPAALIAHALAVEQHMGRVRSADSRWGPRVIDIDVLWMSHGAVRQPQLEVPHPRLHERVFALRPLLDVAPDARDPRSGAPYAELPTAALQIQTLEPL